MELNKQTQTAGDGANQQIAQTINNYNVVQFDESQCRAICSECFEKIRQNLSSAMDVAHRREQAFEDSIISRLEKVENGMAAFADPSFLKSLSKAQNAAICTDKKSDYDLLSELLVKRTEVRDEKQRSLYVNKAIEVVDEIPEAALLGITMVYAFGVLTIESPNIWIVRNRLADIYKHIIDSGSLPNDGRWMEDLDILSIARVNRTSRYKKADEILSKKGDQICVAGLKIGSEEYQKALEILQESGLDESSFSNNPLMEGYVCILRGKIRERTYTYVPVGEIETSLKFLDERQNNSIDRVVDMYDKSPNTIKKVKKAIVDYMKENDTIKSVMDWWDALPYSIDVSSVALMIANVNARRLYPAIPELVQ